MKTFKHTFTQIIGLLGLMAIVSNSHGAAKMAASCSFSDVSTAITSASVGDTVAIPAGTCTWSSTLNISKGISVVGAGKGLTVINNSAATVVKIIKTQNDFVRLSGFTFNNSDQQSPVISIVGPTFKVRIDNIIINKGDAAIASNWMGEKGTGPVYGVVDNSEFYNTQRTYFAVDEREGDKVSGVAAWNEFLGNKSTFPGSDKMLIFEDNQFVWNKSLSASNAQGALYGQYGGKVTFRYNTFKGFCTYVDGHGDLGAGQDYGTIYYEIYNNTFTQDNSFCNQGNIVWMRGGQLIAHDNIFTGSANPFKMSVYYTSDLAAHRVNNTYFWGNSWNGNSNQSSLVDVGDSGQTSAGYSAANIKLNEQYFLNAPQSYSPYTYPHPLRDKPTNVATISPPVLKSAK